MTLVSNPSYILCQQGVIPSPKFGIYQPLRTIYYPQFPEDNLIFIQMMKLIF